MIAKDFLEVEIVIDRPLGSKHPKHGFVIVEFTRVLKLSRIIYIGVQNLNHEKHLLEFKRYIIMK